jgi:hypothetical protein
MEFTEEEITALKLIIPSVSSTTEGGYDYLLLENLPLPLGSQPETVDALLCPKPRDGYESRLFFSSKVTGCPVRNWNGTIRVLGRNWFAISWKVSPGLKLAEMLMIHLKALREP